MVVQEIKDKGEGKRKLKDVGKEEVLKKRKRKTTTWRY